MSEERNIDPAEIAAVDEALAALDPAAAELPRLSGGARAYLETLGALPATLEPIEPSAGLRSSILAAVEAGGGSTEAEVVELPSRRESGSPRPSRWMLRVAAVLAIALAGVSGRQYLELANRQERILAQADTIEMLREELARTSATPDGAPAWMAASGTELCALRPREAAIDNRAKGWLFVRQDHQHWYVRLEGLAPSPEGHVYELWFLVEGELVSGGVFEPDETGRATLTSESMPNPVTGIAVTLEPDDGDVTPSERMVLWGDEVMITL